jgi:hypothetical protein
MAVRVAVTIPAGVSDFFDQARYTRAKIAGTAMYGCMMMMIRWHTGLRGVQADSIPHVQKRGFENTCGSGARQYLSRQAKSNRRCAGSFLDDDGLSSGSNIPESELQVLWWIMSPDKMR